MLARMNILSRNISGENDIQAALLQSQTGKNGVRILCTIV